MTPTATNGKQRSSRYRRPDTYQAAAKTLQVSVPHVYLVIRGERKTSPSQLSRLVAWAEKQAAEGRAEAPAVALTLKNHAA
jgi:predicted DNA-binding transcriptional regulator AlpA